MTSPNLENLARTGELQAEPPAKLEFDGLVASALSFLGDARKPSLAIVSRFNLAYEAAHALSLAALRWHGYRSNNRYMVFQVLEHTLGFKSADWRILADCHGIPDGGGVAGAALHVDGARLGGAGGGAR